MSHFGVLSYKGTGHLNCLIALSRRLVANGHRVTFFLEQEMETRIREAGLEFRAIVSDHCPSSITTENKLRPKPGLSGLRYRINRINDEIDSWLHHAPELLSHARVDALIIDELVLPGPTLAQLLHLPYFIVSTSVPHNFGWSVPHSLLHCSNPPSLAERLQRAFLQVSVFRLRGPIKWRLQQSRKRLGLGPIATIQELHPALAHLATLPACLDFLQLKLPANFHYTGPFVDQTARVHIDFPWEELDGRPLIYVSLGTAKKTKSSLFEIIAGACDGLGMQVVISLGGGRDPKSLSHLKGDPLVAKEAPQLELITRSVLVINHAGINTVLEALMAGKPMVVIPITHDQPALAARLASLEVAEVIPERRLTVQLLRRAITTVLSSASYRQQASSLQKKIQAVDGLGYAVEIIENAMQSNEQRESNMPIASRSGFTTKRATC